MALEGGAFLYWTGSLVFDIRGDLTNLRDAKRYRLRDGYCFRHVYSGATQGS